MAANATLGGTGTLGGDTTIADTGKLAFNLNTAPDTHDKLELASGKTLTFTLDSTLTITTSDLTSSGSYTLVTAPGGITWTKPPTVSLPVGWTLDSVTGNGGNDLVINITAPGGGSPYDTWAGGPGLPFDGDANGDGVENGLAFFLGAANPNENAFGLLPTVTQSGGGLILTFNMRNAIARGTASLNVQHSSDLGILDAWESALTPDSDQTVNDVVFDITAGDPLNGVVATIPASKAASGKLFTRLKVTQIP
ncbi:MAG: hypothetical protein RLZZ245_426 [Verrucomicrobiota bacterium]